MAKIILLATVVVSCSAKVGESQDTGGGTNDSDHSDTSEGGDSTDSGLDLPSCDANPLFSVSPVNLDVVTAIVPLGNLEPAGGHLFPTDHVYFYLSQASPLLAPGEITVTSIERAEYLSDGSVDYRINFASCAEVTSQFQHVAALSEELVAQASSFDEDCEEYSPTGGTPSIRSCRQEVEIAVPAGETIGTTNQWTLDFGTFDSRVTHTYANQELFDEETTLPHAVCPIDYYPSSVMTELEAKLGAFDGSLPRAVEPLCGEVAQDIPGTAQGIWRRSTLPIRPETNHLALVKGNIEPEWRVVSVYNAIPGVSPGAYYFLPEDEGLINRDFADITADGQIYCFEYLENQYHNNLYGFHLLLQMVSDSRLRIVKEDGLECSSPPWTMGGNVAEFER